MKELCVVHLVRAANGIKPLQRFLESYRANPGGIEHDLLIIFKGFENTQSRADYTRLLAPFTYRAMEIPDTGFDITAYLLACKHHAQEYRYFCFLNSFSVLLDKEWLKKLYNALHMTDVGLVGATGSWLSHSTNALLWFKHFPARMLGLKAKSPPPANDTESKGLAEKSFCERVAFKLEWVWDRFLYLFYFDPFPNYMIRTNAFMIEGKTLNALNYPPVKTKRDAYLFESGKHGLTKRILAMGRKVLVVGKDGNAYEKEHWNESGTFHQGLQENLLVADNQTNDYQYASPERQALLQSGSWSSKAFLV
jgi:hypothetical protein